MRDGSVYKGTIWQHTDSLLFLHAADGVVIQIPKSKVSSIEPASGPEPDSLASKPHAVGRKYYVLSSNALPFRAGETYGSSSYLVFFHVNYAFNTHFSLGLSSTLIGAPVALQAKVHYVLGPRMHIGGELAAGTMMYLNPKTYGNAATIKLTFGTTRRNYTFFGGYADLQYWVRRRGRIGSAIYNPGSYYIRYFSPFAGAAVALPMSARLNFTGEGFAFPGTGIYTAAAALRTVGRQRTSFVFGIQIIGNTNTSVNRAFTFPYGGLSIGF